MCGDPAIWAIVWGKYLGYWRVWVVFGHLWVESWEVIMCAGKFLGLAWVMLRHQWDSGKPAS
jgi:hypothetical protein